VLRMLRFCSGSAQACSPSAQVCSPLAQVCSPSAQVKAAVAHVQRLKRNQRKGKLILSLRVLGGLGMLALKDGWG
jgi:3-deoxy-D-arabino-heptulosonate 7-phosphate (DAHP) synthase class II